MASLMRMWRSPMLIWGLLAAVLAGVVYESYAVFRIARQNTLISQPERVEVDDKTPPVLVLAKAHRLERSGETQEALRLYTSILDRGDERLREQVHYNLGTLYLREAAQLWNAKGVLEYVRVNTLVALAKEQLQKTLRLNPANWDARFNLEYAHRITPPAKEREKADWHGAKPSVFATVPTIPGGAP
ncbi:tetratricopeptide repeat protein [Methylocaldum gracile]|jgi:mxaK protein|uniref:MxaK protein n=1 Tax=Methylocaldum sp. 0917 TaxID=2485163 RepID=UPI00105F4474